MEALKTGLWYIATPYSKYPGGIERAFRDAARATALLMQRGVAAYSPVAHTHPIAAHGGIDPLDHEIWLPFDQHMMDRCDGICVVRMETWEQSFGVKHEIDYFTAAGKPVVYIDYPEAA